MDLLDERLCAELAARGQAGDSRAYDQLIKLVVPRLRLILIKRFRVRRRAWVDECAPIIVWEAARRFDVSKNASFVTYCLMRTRPVLRTYMHQTRGGVVEFPYRVSSAMSKQGQNLPLTGVTTKTAQEAVDNELSFGWCNEDFVLAPAPRSTEADAMLAFHELADQVDRVLVASVEGEHRQKLIRQIFDGEPCRTVGDQMGVGRERVRQLYNRVTERVVAELGS